MEFEEKVEELLLWLESELPKKLDNLKAEISDKKQNKPALSLTKKEEERGNKNTKTGDNMERGNRDNVKGIVNQGDKRRPINTNVKGNNVPSNNKVDNSKLGKRNKISGDFNEGLNDEEDNTRKASILDRIKPIKKGQDSKKTDSPLNAKPRKQIKTSNENKPYTSHPINFKTSLSNNNVKDNYKKGSEDYTTGFKKSMGDDKAPYQKFNNQTYPNYPNPHSQNNNNGTNENDENQNIDKNIEAEV